MKYPSTITLFMEPMPPSRRPSAFVVSAVTHVVVITAAALGVFHVPTVSVHYPKERFTLRMVKLQNADDQKRAANNGSAYYPDHKALAQTPSPGGAPSVARTAPMQAVQHLHAPQTLVQPDLPPDLLLNNKIPVPQILLWSAKNQPTPKIVLAPVLHPMVANAKPVIEKPNKEQHVADMKFASMPTLKETAVKLASTTSPVVLKAPELAKQSVPQMASTSTEAPTQARVLSISDVHMNSGAIPLPRVNETASSAATGPLTGAAAAEHSQVGSGKANAVDGTSGNGAGSGSAGKTMAGANTSAKSTAGGQGQGMSDSGSDRGNRPSYDHVKLPRDGVFGVVVVGSAIAEQYPETAEMWSGRLASTVYVHVGLAKSWILQYSLPRTTDAAGLSLARVEAPWPYDIARPTLGEGDLDADALMVHGYVNKDGRFDNLSVVFPPQFARAKFVLDALNQWQFRPAMQNRQPTSVEILLVIPDELN
jgi:hypothetical protein